MPLSGTREARVPIMESWFVWALCSAVFAALTAVLAKLGLRGVDADLATLIRTGIIAVVLSLFVVLTGKWSNPLQLSGKTWLFLGLSGLATGASWTCYFRALQLGEAQPGAGGRLCGDVPGRAASAARVAGHCPGGAGRAGAGHPPLAAASGGLADRAVQWLYGWLFLQPFVKGLIQQPGVVTLAQNPHRAAAGAAAAPGNLVAAGRNAPDGFKVGQGQTGQAVAGVNHE
jgi:hypothetical protein